MNEIKIFENDPELADPYSGRTQPQYSTPWEVYDRLQEMRTAEENNFWELLPDDLAELASQDENMSENMNRNRMYYYRDKAYGILESFSDDDIPYMALALYQADTGMTTDFDTSEIITTLLNNSEAAKMAGLKKLVCEHILKDDPAKKRRYGEFIETLQVEVNEYDKRQDFNSIFDTILGIMKGWGWLVELDGISGAGLLRRDVNTFYNALRERLLKLDLGKYLVVFVQGRELCLNFDRYIRELEATVQLNNDLRRFYAQKEAVLLEHYKAKEEALRLEYEAKLNLLTI
jgi:hypothetical protein